MNEENKNIEDALFDMFRTEADTVPIGKFLAVNGKFISGFFWVKY